MFLEYSPRYRFFIFFSAIVPHILSPFVSTVSTSLSLRIGLFFFHLRQVHD
mgnify:CR=1 FL=1|jgi:hypothetical protein